MNKTIALLIVMLTVSIGAGVAKAEKCHYCDFSDEPIVVAPTKPAQSKGSHFHSTAIAANMKTAPNRDSRKIRARKQAENLKRNKK